MTTTTATLTSFLLARIAEDEKVAQSFTYNWSDAQESLRRRFLTDCAAKRRIVEDAQHLADRGPGVLTAHAEWTCRALALPYADHPDYNPDWRP